MDWGGLGGAALPYLHSAASSLAKSLGSFELARIAADRSGWLYLVWRESSFSEWPNSLPRGPAALPAFITAGKLRDDHILEVRPEELAGVGPVVRSYRRIPSSRPFEQSCSQPLIDRWLDVVMPHSRGSSRPDAWICPQSPVWVFFAVRHRFAGAVHAVGAVNGMASAQAPCLRRSSGWCVSWCSGLPGRGRDR